MKIFFQQCVSTSCAHYKSKKKCRTCKFSLCKKVQKMCRFSLFFSPIVTEPKGFSMNSHIDLAKLLSQFYQRLPRRPCLQLDIATVGFIVHTLTDQWHAAVLWSISAHSDKEEQCSDPYLLWTRAFILHSDKEELRLPDDNRAETEITSWRLNEWMNCKMMCQMRLQAGMAS